MKRVLTLIVVVLAVLFLVVPQSFAVGEQYDHIRPSSGIRTNGPLLPPEPIDHVEVYKI